MFKFVVFLALVAFASCRFVPSGSPQSDVLFFEDVSKFDLWHFLYSLNYMNYFRTKQHRSVSRSQLLEFLAGLLALSLARWSQTRLWRLRLLWPAGPSQPIRLRQLQRRLLRLWTSTSAFVMLKKLETACVFIKNQNLKLTVFWYSKNTSLISISGIYLPHPSVQLSIKLGLQSSPGRHLRVKAGLVYFSIPPATSKRFPLIFHPFSVPVGRYLIRWKFHILLSNKSAVKGLNLFWWSPQNSAFLQRNTWEFIEFESTCYFSCYASFFGILLPLLECWATAEAFPPLTRSFHSMTAGSTTFFQEQQRLVS